MNKNVQLNWVDLVDLLLRFHEDGNPEYRNYAQQALRNMASFADAANATLPLITRLTELMQPDGGSIQLEDDVLALMQGALADFAAIPSLPELPAMGQAQAA